MKAAKISRFGGPEVLEIAEVPRPEPREREVLVKVYGSALNRADVLQRMGNYPPPPGASEIPGLEFAGEVVANGPGASRWKIGERVFGIVAGGAHAEFVTTHEETVSPIPENLSWSQAAAVPEVFFTAHDALRQANFKTGDRVLIHAVGSGVGLAATAIVSAFGGQAFGTSRTPDKIERARTQGLVDGFTSLEGIVDWAKQVTGGHGFNIVLDLNGGPYFSASLATMAKRGHVILIGATAGAKSEIDLRLVFGKRLHIIGTVMRARSVEEKAAVNAAFAEDVLPLLAAGRVSPVIDSEFPLHRIADAHRRLESNDTFGKVVLRIAE